MADIRALLAQERASRRITHPHLTYTKSGALICNVCQLNVKSETLWDGHLRSANHKKNVAAQQANAMATTTTTTKTLKRKHEDDDEDEQRPQPPPDAERERRKMPKSRAVSLAEKATIVAVESDEAMPAVPPLPSQPTSEIPDRSAAEPSPPLPHPPSADHLQSPPTQQPIDEDEYAAFERDIAAVDELNHLADDPYDPSSSSLSVIARAPDYESATISAPALTAAQLAEQAAEAKRKQQEILAEDADADQDDERGRLEEEMEIMEEMEERVRRLRERREALRSGSGGGAGGVDAIAGDSGGGVGGEAGDTGQNAGLEEQDGKGQEEESDTDSGSDVDDWYS